MTSNKNVYDFLNLTQPFHMVWLVLFGVVASDTTH